MRASAPPTRLLPKEKKNHIHPPRILFFFCFANGCLDLQCKSNAFTNGNTKVLFVVVKFIYLQLTFFLLLFAKVRVGGGRIPLAAIQFFGWQMLFFFLEQKNSFRLFILFFGNFPHRLFCIADRAGGGLTDRPSPPFSKMEERGSEVIGEKALSADVRTAFIYTEVRYSRYFFPYIFS